MRWTRRRLELRRVERDLHDGAQARLVALGMALRATERLIKTNPDAAVALVAEARENSARALAELRALVRGINPPVLAERGLGDAIRALALDCPVATTADIDLPGTRPGAGGDGRLLRGRRGAGQRGQARRRAPSCTSAADAGVAGELRIEVSDDGSGRRRSVARQRAARCGAPTGYIRRRAGGQQPAGRADHRRDRGAVRVVIAEDLFLLREGLASLLKEHGFDVAGSGRRTGRRCCAR